MLGYDEELTFDQPDDDESDIAHYGTKRHSGRYPWGSGENPYQHDGTALGIHARLKRRITGTYDENKSTMSKYKELQGKGLSETEIAIAMGYKNSSSLRAAISQATNEIKADDKAKALKLIEKYNGNISAAARAMGKNESTLRSLIKEKTKRERKGIVNTMNILKEELNRHGEFIDVGKMSNLYLGITKSALDTACDALENEGYSVINTYIENMSSPGNTIPLKVLAPKGTTKADVLRNQDLIHSLAEAGVSISRDTKEPVRLHDPVSVDSKRVYVRYDEEGGTDKDGTIEIRPGVKDLNLGNNRYAQVRVLVDGDKYMKGMAYYSDDVPEGYDMIYNSNKTRDKANKVFKSIDEKYKKDDIRPVDRFGALISHQNDWVDEDGKKHEGALNIIREEGDWTDWSDNVASQFLSKQRPEVAKRQLQIDYAERADEFDEICKLTNPVLKKTLLSPFADECDSAAVDLKAAAFPKQGWHVILPNPKLKKNEIYAPNYENGDRVILVRYPHGGIFEIPELTVNNNSRSSAKMIGKNALDAVVVNKTVADQLSGADFDGDTVLVIPNNDGKFKVKKPLQGLIGWDTKAAYPPVKGAPVASVDKAEVDAEKAKAQKEGRNPNLYLWHEQLQMGMVSNLITDMTNAGAPDEELERAVKHSMVIIDVKKHSLDWKRSEQENDIQQLRNKYQAKADPTKPGGGASSLMSRASSEERVRERARAYTEKDENGNYIIKEGIYVDTGKKAYRLTNRRITQKNKKTGEYEEGKYAEQKSTKMYETPDARTLMSGPNHEGTTMERYYADYANKCKALGNAARKEFVGITLPKKDPAAAKEYAEEVASLSAKLQNSMKNKPLERLAQIRANLKIQAMRRDGNAAMLSGAEWKKEKQKALQRARRDVGAKQESIKITDREWEAIQHNAISPTTLKDIFAATDLDELKKRAMPRDDKGLSNAKVARIKAYANSGRTQLEIAQALGISVSTVRRILRGEEDE